MTEQSTTTTPDELTVLKARAKTLGIKFSNNIKLETLRDKVNEAMGNGSAAAPENAAAPVDAPSIRERIDEAIKAKPGTYDFSGWSQKDRKMFAREQGRQAQALVRCRIYNLDPKKKNVPGEIITVANRYMGTIRKLIPFGEATDGGYHIPRCVYDNLKSRKFLSISSKRDKRTGTNVTKTRWVPEYNIEVLPALTQEELDKLAADQRASGRIEDGREDA